jgi:EAL domain-containing protein (putative c-di-GMP-specific phosphodiesterase class I)
MKEYDDIIKIFGYKFANDLLALRLESIGFISLHTTIYEVGFWSIGFVLRPAVYEPYRAVLDNNVNRHAAFLGKLAARLAEPIICRGIPLPIKAGIGVCDLKKGVGSAEDMLQSTFSAGQVNGVSPAGWTECKYDQTEDHRRAFTIIADVALSLATPDEFELVFQPRMDLRTAKYNCAEALLRWRHPMLGLIPPSEFIPLVEKTGMIRELSNWVLSHAITWAAAWHKKNIALKVAVNVSVKNLAEEDFVERIMSLLQQHGLHPKYLELEFSESSIIFDFESAKTKLRVLRDLGVIISIDDFGTGLNSFSYLESTPANALKIDQALVFSLKDNLRNHAIVRSMIFMAHEIGLEVVAEGVEDRKVLDLLAAWRCDGAQGYYMSKPLNAAAFEEWIAGLSITLRPG